MRQAYVSASAALLALSCFLHPAAAKADTFLFTASGSGLTLVASLTGTPDASTPGAFDITGGSGTANGTAVTLYTPSGTSTSPQTANFTSPPFTHASNYTYDNVVYTTGNSGLVLDQDGLLFSAPDDHFNVFGLGPNYVYTDDEIVNGLNSDAISVTLADVSATTPEPASIALLATGLLGTAGILRRRRSA
jgi:hypothetical protein